MRIVCYACSTWPARALLVSLGIMALASIAAAQDGRSLWVDQPFATFAVDADRTVEPRAYRALQVDATGLADLLAAAPRERIPGDFSAGLVVALPLPDGGFATYRVVESSVMAPGLQARFPDIRTYLGRGIDEPGATLRLSLTSHGVHAASRRSAGTFYIDPATQFDRGNVVSYWRRSLPPRDGHRHAPDFIDDTDDLLGAVDGALRVDGAARSDGLSNGQLLRTYRIAIAATGEYTRFHSADSLNVTIQEGLAAIAVALNRVNEIYEREVAVRMVLVEHNDRIVYTDPDTDPYSNFNGSAMLGQNQTNLDAVIGPDNYDIGHVFSTGGGGLASLGVVCWRGFNARGVTGLPRPINDPFYVDYVAHEIGHQFRANHTFNGSSGGCSGNQRNRSTAFEPGSGSTIMAYAGICSAQNLQTFSHDYFHNASLTEITNFITTGRGSTCGAVVETQNAIPEPVVTGTYAIPRGTPFVLSGTATYDGDPASLTFAWEGTDLGAASPPPGVDGWADAAPFFRSFPPSASGTRFFPRLDAYVTRQPTLGEGLPESERVLNFRFTVRNNAPGGGAVRDRQVAVSVSGVAGPFVVTSPRDTVTWEGGTEQIITWDVAGTRAAEFGGETVDILLSRDLHHDFVDGTAIILASRVPNAGSARVRVPYELDAPRARLMVRASDGIFFNVTTSDTRIVFTEEPPVERPVETVLSPVFPNPIQAGSGRATINLALVDVDPQHVRILMFDALGREVTVLHDGTLSGEPNHQFSFETRNLAAGVYYVRAVGRDFSLVRPVTVVR